MTIKPRLWRYALIALMAVPVATAVAADPKPEPCNGIFATDPGDDGVYSPGGTLDPAGLLEGPAPENLELLNVFLNNKAGADGKKVLTLNLTLKNLTLDVPAGLSSTGGNWYYGYYLWQDRVRFVRAANTGTEITYAYGYVTSEANGGDPLGGVYQTEGDTTGSFSEGPNGVVSIVIPEAIGGKTGETLGALGGSAETIEGQDDFFGINHQADISPDGYSITSPEGPSYVVTDCPSSGTSAPATTPPPATGGETPPPPPSTAPAQPSGTTTLPFKAASTLGSAKKAVKKKALSFKVTAGKPISNLKLALIPAKGGKPVGTATIKSLKAGTSTIKLKVSKKLKAGKYALAANGVVDGKQLGTTQKVTVKK